MHTTNYINTFIEIAEDCITTAGVAPPQKDAKTAAQIEYEILMGNPYQYTSDDVLYQSNGNRRGISREEFFSKGQPCFRASALCKRYGWGVHSNDQGKVAIYAVGTPDYIRLSKDENIKHIRAMRSSNKNV